jgi:hypothetical protein
MIIKKSSELKNNVSPPNLICVVENGLHENKKYIPPLDLNQNVNNIYRTNKTNSCAPENNHLHVSSYKAKSPYSVINTPKELETSNNLFIKKIL